MHRRCRRPRFTGRRPVAEVFGETRPATTMVEISALIAPELLVEIEADAYSRTDPPVGENVPSAAGK
jgi:hypothetical protein